MSGEGFFGVAQQESLGRPVISPLSWVSEDHVEDLFRGFLRALFGDLD